MAGHITLHGIDLYQEDVDSCRDGQYFRTNVTAYGLAQARSIHAAKGDAAAAAVVLDPSVVQCMVQFGDVTLGPIDEMLAAGLWLIPLSSYKAATTVNTTGHWSLLAVEIIDQVDPVPAGADASADERGRRRGRRPRVAEAFHIDSCGSLNGSIAQDVFRFLAAGFSALDGDLRWGAQPTPVPSAPQQPNTYDCGPYMVCAAGSLLRWTYAQTKDRPKPTTLRAALADDAESGDRLLAYSQATAAQLRTDYHTMFAVLMARQVASRPRVKG